MCVVGITGKMLGQFRETTKNINILDTEGKSLGNLIESVKVKLGRTIVDLLNRGYNKKYTFGLCPWFLTQSFKIPLCWHTSTPQE